MERGKGKKRNLKCAFSVFPLHFLRKESIWLRPVIVLLLLGMFSRVSFSLFHQYSHAETLDPLDYLIHDNIPFLSLDVQGPDDEPFSPYITPGEQGKEDTPEGDLKGQIKDIIFSKFFIYLIIGVFSFFILLFIAQRMMRGNRQYEDGKRGSLEQSWPVDRKKDFDSSRYDSQRSHDYSDDYDDYRKRYDEGGNGKGGRNGRERYFFGDLSPPDSGDGFPYYLSVEERIYCPRCDFGFNITHDDQEIRIRCPRCGMTGSFRP